MPSRTRRAPARALTSGLALLALALPAAAEGPRGGFRGVEPFGPAHPGAYGPAYGDAYGGAYGYGGGYGFAGEFVSGSYIGAPLTRVPSPQRIVPTPWSYGTYGVPTVSGIPPAPVAQPTLLRIDARGSGPAAGARVIDVQVPRR